MLRYRKRLLVGLLAAFAVALVAGAAQAAGNGDLDTQRLLERVIRATQARRHYLLLLAAIFVVVAGIWLTVRRQRRALVALALAALIAGSAFGVYELRYQFPNQGVFSSERLNDSAAILLGTDIRLSHYR